MILSTLKPCLVALDLWLLLNVLVGCIFYAIRKQFTPVGTSLLRLKGYEIWVYFWCIGPLSREGSLSCHSCSDTETRLLRPHSKDVPFVASHDKAGLLRTCFYPNFPGMNLSKKMFAKH